MIVSAQVAVYALRQDRLTPAITAVSEALRAAGLRPEVGAHEHDCDGRGRGRLRGASGGIRPGRSHRPRGDDRDDLQCLSVERMSGLAGTVAALRARCRPLRGMVCDRPRPAGRPRRARTARALAGTVRRGTERAGGRVRYRALHSVARRQDAARRRPRSCDGDAGGGAKASPASAPDRRATPTTFPSGARSWTSASSCSRWSSSRTRRQRWPKQFGPHAGASSWSR